MTKSKLLSQVDLAIKNKAFLLVNAGDYFTDYYKLIRPSTVTNFRTEVEKYGINMDDYESVRVKINSVDVEECGCMTGDLNQYFVYKAKPVLPKEVAPLLSYLD